MNLTELGVRRPVTTLMAFLAVLVIGMVMVLRLSVDYLPEIDNPTVTVVTEWSGASTEDVEIKVTKLIERALGSVNNLKEITSATTEGISSVTCEFIWGTNLDEASNDMRSNVDRVKGNLPDDAEEPRFMKFNTSQIPIQFYGVTARENVEDLYEIIDREVADPVKRLPGVGTVNLFGGLQREIQVMLYPAKLTAFGLALPGGEEIAYANAERVCAAARAAGTTVTVDRAYVERSIRDPSAQRREVASGSMPAYADDRITDDQIDDLVSFLKALK